MLFNSSQIVTQHNKENLAMSLLLSNIDNEVIIPPGRINELNALLVHINNDITTWTKNRIKITSAYLTPLSY